MISMTGYGNCESQNDKISFSIELKSINSKYFESNIKIPYLFSQQEQKILDILRDKLIRGRVNFNLIYRMKESSSLVYNLDYAKLDSHKHLLNNINNKLDEKIELKDILSFRDIISLEKKEIDSDIIDLLYQTLDNVISEHNEFRKKEGEFIKKDILMHMSKIDLNIKNIESVWENKKNEYFNKYNDKIICFCGSANACQHASKPSGDSI